MFMHPRTILDQGTARIIIISVGSNRFRFSFTVSVQYRSNWLWHYVLYLYYYPGVLCSIIVTGYRRRDNGNYSYRRALKEKMLLWVL